jgi:aminoglycoside phosphotransferase (APT) family kinase protein
MKIDSPEERLDPRKILAALDYHDVSEIQRIRGGWDTIIWRFQTGDGEFHSLRVHFLPQREGMARREVAALRACQWHGFSAPRVELVCRLEQMPLVVLSWCPGRPLLSKIESSPWSIIPLSRRFGEAQARLHAIPPPPELAANAPDEWIYRVPAEYRWLSEQLTSERLQTSSLLHMDYHPLNVLAEDGRITGVVDWTGAAAGDPRADLARTHVTLETAPIPPGPLRPLFSVLRGVMLRSWRAGYGSVAGVVPEYDHFKAWAGATLLAEITQVIGNTGVWGTDDDVRSLRANIAIWAKRSGEAPSGSAKRVGAKARWPLTFRRR